MNGNSRVRKPTYLCQTCGHRASKWMGFCPQCRTQEALVEAVTPTSSARDVEVVSATAPNTTVRDRVPVGIGEFDRVLGGGIVPGAGILLGGEPGVGKSTLLLQVADSLASEVGSVLIATAEESTHQVQMRARRVGVSADGVDRSEERRVGKDRRSVDLGGRRIIKKKKFFQAEDGIRDLRT